MSDPRRYAPVRWPASRGTNGRFAMEQMAAFAWNRWPESVEYARTSFVDGASGHSHQIDVQIRGDSDLYLIECKCWKYKAPVESVLAFYGRICDIRGCQTRTVHGSMVTKKGYQPGAKKVADHFGIDLAVVKSESEFSIHFKGNVWVGTGGTAVKAQGGEVKAITTD